MKKLILTFGIILLALYAMAQDTLVMTDGSKVLAQIISENGDEVRYKSWSNLSGPTWIKPKHSISMIKRARRITIQPGEVLNFSDCSSDKPNTECISGNEIIWYVDEIYSQRRESLETVKKELFDYVASLPSCIQKKCVYRYYWNRFEHSKEMEVVDYVLQDGETYLLLGGEEHLEEVVETLVLLYAAGGKNERVEWWMDFFRRYSEENDDLFAEEIKRLSTKKEELLHPYRWEDEIKGKWVLLGRVSNKGVFTTIATTECPLILDVRDVSTSTGAYMLEPNQSVPSLRNQEYPQGIYSKPINESQSIFFNGEENYSLFQFASMDIIDGRWKTPMAHSIVDYSRETSAEIIEYIKNLNINPEDKLYKGLAVAATASAIELMATNMNTSSKNDHVYTVLVYPNKPNLMNAFVSHVSATTITPSEATQNVRTVYNEYVKDKKSYMVRWEESDSVCFVSANRNPVTLHPVDGKDPILDEYRRIKYNHSILSPKVFLPLLGCNALATFLFIHGLDLYDRSFARDENGNKIPTGMGGEVEIDLYNKSSWYIGVSLGCFLAVNVGIITIVLDHRNRAYDELNLKNMEKLRRKASASLSMSPTYNPEYNTLGANINLSF